MANDVMLQARLRPGKDDDLIAWYLGQEDRSAAVRTALRAYLQSEDSADDPLRDLPGLVTAAVQAALEGMQLAPATPSPDADSGEDAALAARLDEQLDGFWDG
jgi:Arc/MetJ-type ribon-helix-helix transcriptional regulator